MKSPILSKDLIPILESAKVVSAEVRICVPSFPSAPYVDNCLRPTVVVEFTVSNESITRRFKSIPLDISMTNYRQVAVYRTLERHILKAIHPNLTRQSLRVKSTDAAMCDLIKQIKKAVDRSRAAFDQVKLNQKVRDVMGKRKLRVQENKIKGVKESLIGILSEAFDLGLDDDELNDIIDECRVRSVQEA